MKKLTVVIAVIAVLLALVGCTAIQNGAYNVISSYGNWSTGYRPRTVYYLNDVNERTGITGKALYLYQRFKNRELWKSI